MPIMRLTRIITVISLYTLFAFPAGAVSPALQKPIFVEIFLAREKKGDIEAIRQAFKAYSIDRVDAQFFKVGYPPQNIAIGSAIPASVARQVINLAIQHNRGITHLLPQFRFFPNQIAIGSSAFDERVPVPIAPQDLKRLRNADLSDSEFRTLYRELTGEKQFVLGR